MKNSANYALLICVAGLTLFAFTFYPKWKMALTEATISWDASGYYMYLPATFIYKDLKKCAFGPNIAKTYVPSPYFDQAFKHEPSGNYVMKYSMGQAVTMLPFFTIGHYWAKYSKRYPTTGFSYPYQKSIGVGMLLYALLGLYLLKQILSEYFAPIIVGITLLLITFGTNYLNYAGIDQAMTHSNLFTLYALLIWLTIRYYKSPSLLKGLGIGLIIGLATLIRPTEIISLLIPILWHIKNWSEIKERMNYFLSNKVHVLAVIAGVAFFVMWQPIYWHYITGDWIVYSYQDQGFSWFAPHVKDYLFSFKCGWLRYTPMMILALVGLVPYIRDKVRLEVGIVAVIAVAMYITTAWDIWDYGGPAGRAMVQYYPVLAFPLSSIISAANRKSWSKFGFYTLCLGATYLNVWWVYHAHNDKIRVININKHYYNKMVGRWADDGDYIKLLDNRDYYEGETTGADVVYFNDFKSDTTVNHVHEGDEHYIHINKSNSQTKEYFFTADASKKKKWLRVTALLQGGDKEWEDWRMPQFIVRFYKGEELTKTNFIRVHRLLNPGEKKYMSLDAKYPDQYDKISIAFQSFESDKALSILSLQAIAF